MVYNEALKAEVILPDSNPFRQFKVGSYDEDYSKVKFLEHCQVEEIEKVLINNTNLPELTVNIGWRFLSMCVSGIRISDAMLLDEYFFNDAGNLQFKSHKTRRHNNTAYIPINTDRQRSYFAETLKRKLPETSAKSFRTTFNIHLEVIAVLAGIEINLISHAGRHTMGGFIADAGIESKPAMAMLGVKSKRVIEGYLHLKKDKLQSEGNKLGNVM